MLDLKKLTYLDAIYNYQSFTKASEVLFVSQSNLSAAVASLEQELGVKLISRSSKMINFTPEGKLFIEHAQQILRFCEDTENMMRDFSLSADPYICVGVSQAVSTFLLPQIFTCFLADNPHAKMQFDEGDMFTHLDALKKDSLDLVFNGLPVSYDPETLEVIKVSSSRLHAIVPLNHPYAGRDSISLETLAEDKLAVLGSPGRALSALKDAFTQKELVPHIDFTCNHYSCLLEVLAACDYVGIINVFDHQPLHLYEDFALTPFEYFPPIPIGFIYKKNKYLSKLGRSFIQFVEDVYRQQSSATETALR